MICPDPRGIILRGEGVADNEKWATSGEGPWSGAEEVSHEKEKTAGPILHMTKNMDYLFISEKIRT